MSGWRVDRRIEVIGLLALLAVVVGGLVIAGRVRQARGGFQQDASGGRPHRLAAPVGSASRWNFRAAMNTLDGIIDAVNEGDWERAREFFVQFRQSVPTLPSPGLKHPDISLALVDFFNLYRVQLERALTAEQADRAIFACNQLGNIVWDLRVHLNPTALPEVGRLHYLRRDLEYWASLGDEDMLRLRSQGLEKTWDDLRPVVIDRKGREAAEDVDSLMVRLKRARTVEEYQEIASEISTALGQVEMIFSDIK
jgi:hypothetical protein